MSTRVEGTFPPVPAAPPASGASTDSTSRMSQAKA